MIEHPAKYSERLTDDNIDSIISTSLKIICQTGITVQSERLVDKLKAAGTRVDENSGRILFSKKMIEEHLKLVPAEWTWYARNPKRSVKVGGKTTLVAPGYGSAFVADSDGGRRNATMSDLENLTRLACNSETIDVTGGLLVEPNDISLQLRPLETTQTLVRHSDKPFMGSVAGSSGATESLEIARIVFGDITNKACVVGLININSPMRLDSQMAEALFEYVTAGQPVLLTPGILMGITAPVTTIGALVQAYAELLACVTLVQVIRPGAKLMIGVGGFGSDLRDGTTGFGRPENALGIQLGAEVARRLNIPFRCSAAVTGSRRPDCRSGYERMMTALAAYNAGAHFCLQAAGILDSINMMSYEQYLIDLEIWSYIKRFAKSPVVNEETLATDVILTNTNGLLAHEHTLKHMRNELYAPLLAPPANYEDWWANAGQDVVAQAAEKVKEMLEKLTSPPLDENTEHELTKYVTKRKMTLKSTA